MKQFSFTVAIAAATVFTVCAQETGAISTDRPDFTESTDTIAPGLVQLEGGFLLSRHAMGATPQRQIGAPYALLRLGLTSFAELRFDADGFSSESHLINGAWEQHGGNSDLEIGAKVRVLNEKVHLPALAFIAGASVPTGSSYFSSDRIDPFLEVAWSKSLPRGFEAGGNINFRWGGSETEHGYSLSVGHSLGHGFGSYSEIYRISPIDGDEAAHWIANGGITKLLGENVQLDLEAGHTINARTPHWFVGAGFAIRMAAPRLIASALNHFH